MSIFSVRFLATSVLAVAVVTSGCASPPTADKTAAEQAVGAARAAGAEKYASNDFVAATTTLKEAETQMAAKKYADAKTAYLRAKELAEKAAKAVEGGKAAMKSQVEAQLAEVEKRWQDIEAKVKVAMVKFKVEQKQAWESDARGARDALQAAKGTAGDDPAVAKDQLATVTSAVAKWDEQLRAIPAPAKRGK